MPKTFGVFVMIIPGQSVFDAIRWRNNPQYAGTCLNLIDLFHWFFTDAKRSWGKLDAQIGVGMPKVAILLMESQ